jgi:hypothetical protein
MARATKGDRQRHWREVIERQRASGQSIVGFCMKEGVSPASFHAWKRRLRRRPRREARQEVAQALLPVQVVDAVPIGASKLEVEWPDGVMLRVQGCEAQTVAAVVAALATPPARRTRRC